MMEKDRERERERDVSKKGATFHLNKIGVSRTVVRLKNEKGSSFSGSDLTKIACQTMLYYAMVL